MKTGIELIAEERQRQIEVEGWTSQHDDEHKDNEMPLAAACYCIAHTTRTHPEKRKDLPLLKYWPWEAKFWKPAKGRFLELEDAVGEILEVSDEERIRELQKAGSLIAADIDRIQRKKWQKEIEAYHNKYRKSDYES